MKNFKIVLVLVTLLSSKHIHGQLSFTISPTRCEGSTATVTANTGTLTALQYSWGLYHRAQFFQHLLLLQQILPFPPQALSQ